MILSKSSFQPRCLRTMIVITSLLLLFPLAAAARDSEMLKKSGEAQVGKQAPWFSGWSIDNHVYNLRKPFEEPQVSRVALVFWATWCKPCVEGITKLNDAKARLDAAGTKVVLINYKEPAEKVKDFVSKHTLVYPIVIDQYGQTEKTFIESCSGSVSLPRTIVIDRNMTVKAIIGSEGDDYVNVLLTQ